MRKLKLREDGELVRVIPPASGGAEALLRLEPTELLLIATSALGLLALL